MKKNSKPIRFWPNDEFGRCVIADPADFLSVIEFCRVNPGIGIRLVAAEGITARLLEQIADIPLLKTLVLDRLDLPEWPTAWKNLKSLRTIALLNTETFVPLDEYQQIYRLEVPWMLKYEELVGTLSNLHTLSLSNFPFAEIDPGSFPTGLRKLILVSPRLLSLSGISALKNLEELEIYGAKQLVDVSALKTARKLRKLWIEECPKIAGVEILAHCVMLNKLSLSGIRHIPSIGFLRSLKKLEYFAFVRTIVDDGDLSPLLKLRYAGFMNRRNYSHTFEQVKAEIEKQGRGIYEI